MAEANSILNIIVRLHDEASKQLQGFSSKLKEMEPQFKTMRNVGVAGFGAIAAAVGYAYAQANEAEASFNRLNHILKTSRGATDAQVDALIRQGKALEKIGVVSADNIMVAQSQLATFDLTSSAIERLTPAILDYVVAEKGANATTEDLKQLTNGLAQALQGNFGSLTRTGFVLDEVTKAMIENGTETERTEALVRVLNSTYEGMNASARATGEGGLKVISNQLNEIAQTIGEVFKPHIDALIEKIKDILPRIIEWVKANENLVFWVTVVVAGLFALLAIIGFIGLAVIALTSGFGFLGAAIGVITSPIGLVIVAIIALGVWFKWLWNNSDKVVNALIEGWTRWRDFWVELWNAVKGVFRDAWEGIKGIFGAAIDWMMAKLAPLLNAISAVRDGFRSVTGYIGSQFQAAGSIIGSNITAGLNAIGFAEGGIVTRPTLAMIGEGGEAEAVIPLSKMAGMGGITVNIYGDVSGEELISKVKEGLMRQLRQDTKFSL